MEHMRVQDYHPSLRCGLSPFCLGAELLSPPVGWRCSPTLLCAAVVPLLSGDAASSILTLDGLRSFLIFEHV